MYTIACFTVADAQLILSWLFSWEIPCNISHDSAINIDVDTTSLSSSRIATLKGCGAYFSIYGKHTRKLILKCQSTSFIIPAHVIE